MQGTIISRILQSAVVRDFKRYWRDILLNRILSSPFIPCFLRNLIMRIWTKGGMKGIVMCNCYFESPKFKLGNNSYINRGCRISNGNAGVSIGDNCTIAYDVALITVTHEIGTPERRSGRHYGREIVIDDGCWIGARSVILPGVHIHKGVVIAAGSVVIKDCEENCLYAGNPAVKKKKLD